MIELSALNMRTFDVKLKSGDILHINPPKIKVLRKIFDLTKNSENDITTLSEATVLVLNCNSGKKVFDTEYVEENLDIKDISQLLQGYFSWVGEIKNNPN